MEELQPIRERLALPDREGASLVSTLVLPYNWHLPLRREYWPTPATDSPDTEPPCTLTFTRDNRAQMFPLTHAQLGNAYNPRLLSGNVGLVSYSKFSTAASIGADVLGPPRSPHPRRGNSYGGQPSKIKPHTFQNWSSKPLSGSVLYSPFFKSRIPRTPPIASRHFVSPRAAPLNRQECWP